jgi:phosphate transport system substrate-binding protein
VNVISEILSVLAETLAGQGGIVTLVIALAGTIAWRLVDNRLSRNRDELLHRTRVNSPLTLGPPRAGEIVKIHSRRGPELAEPSLVVLRVKKAGPKALSHDHFDGSLRFIFDDRTVEAAEATEASPPALAGLVSERLRYRNHPNAELRVDVNGEEIPADQLRIPSFVINQDERFNLLVLLSGPGTAIRSDGHILGARIRDDTGRQLKATRRTVAGGLALLLAGALGVALVFTFGRPFSPQPAECRSGNLTVAGSSAFGSIANQVAQAYAATCTDAHITVLEPGSLQGAQDLVAAGAGARDTRLALTDGTVPYQGLVGQPVAVILYSFVANPSVTVPNLTMEQVRGIFAGRYTNWAVLGGPDLPIRIIGRDHASGSRTTLEKYVLGGNGQGALSSQQCLDKDRDASALTIVCEQSSTTELLRFVKDTPGAIGYADVADAGRAAGVTQLRIDGHKASLDEARQGYPFWAVEYVYSFGKLTGHDSLAAAYVEYLTSTRQSDTLKNANYPPCVAGDGTREELCVKGR